MPSISGLPAVLVLALGLGLFPAGPAALADPIDPPPAPVISWAACPSDSVPEDVDAECGTVAVPLDYDDPTGPTLPLDLVRVPATDPAHRIGTLFVNPGGPGGPSTSFAIEFGHLVPPVVAQRFDIVGIDPRGVGQSAPAICRNPDPRPKGPRSAFPTTAREVRVQIASDRWQRAACRDHPAPVVDHMSTADTARDMDLIREALGDDLITYFGISYGTQLGSTYAALFPDHIRAMILDGVLDPVSWSTGRPGETDLPFSTRVGSHRGAWAELRAAFDACDAAGPRRCAIAGHALTTWRHVVNRLRRGPFQGIRYVDLIGATTGSLYYYQGVRSLMRRLGRIEDAMRGATGSAQPRVWRRAARRAAAGGPLPGPYAGPTGYGRTYNAFAGVACADSDNPTSPAAWTAAARGADQEAPGFGSLWTWRSSVCAGWPEQAREDRFVGSYAVTPSAPVLVVGNTYDPATPIAGARAVHELLAGSRLLELHGFGHGALGSGPCIRKAYGAYLVDGVLPAEGTVCQPSHPLFPR